MHFIKTPFLVNICIFITQITSITNKYFHFRVMIWTDWGNQKIEFAKLDGSERWDLVTKDIGYPNGVSYDFASKRVFWCDARRDIIGYVDLLPLYVNEATRNRGKINLAKGEIIHPFGITVFDGHIYWTDWGKRAIMRTDMKGKNVTQMRKGRLSLMGLRIYHKDKQPEAGKKDCLFILTLQQ